MGSFKERMCSMKRSEWLTNPGEHQHQSQGQEHLTKTKVTDAQGGPGVHSVMKAEAWRLKEKGEASVRRVQREKSRNVYWIGQ